MATVKPTLDNGARAERDGALGGGAGTGKLAKGSGGKPSTWKPLELGKDFSIDLAWDTAMNKAVRKMNWSLESEGVVMSMPQDDDKTGVLAMVDVTEKETNKVLKSYNAAAFLSMYAAREKLNGVVVDGCV